MLFTFVYEYDIINIEVNCMVDTKDIIGYCKECGVCMVVNNKIPGYDIFECQNCGHPNSIGDMWYTSEDQYEKAKLLVGGD